MEKKWDTVVPADLKIFKWDVYVPLVTKGLIRKVLLCRTILYIQKNPDSIVDLESGFTDDITLDYDWWRYFGAELLHNSVLCKRITRTEDLQNFVW
jgi:hypothetical protein